MSATAKRIGIDVRYLSHGLVGGVHTYVRNFVPLLVEQATDCEIVLYADTKRPFELNDLPARVTVRRLPWSGPLSSIRHDLLLRREIARDRLDVVHFPANYGIGPAGTRTVLTVHDAINLLPLREIVRGHPKSPGTVAKMTYLHLWTRYSARRASLILTVSRYAGREIAREGGIEPGRIVPIPHAPTPDLLQPVGQAALMAVRDRLAIGRSFVMADALKNPLTLIRAWDLLPASLRTSHELVFFCRRDDVPPPVLEAERRGTARLLLRPSREELIALYRMAEAFAFPSWIEGFGLPILEAMTCGAPVVASDRGAIPEVAGDAALLADAEDPAGFAWHLEAVLSKPALAHDLRERGFARAAQFSWAATARQILDAYAWACADRPKSPTQHPSALAVPDLDRAEARVTAGAAR
jgi:glycosyltransferase involved in cell wall biosynthesis